ncbi:MAG TPA: hypothetical protein VGK59_19290 [Ohtaekwangia sp.]
MKSKYGLPLLILVILSTSSIAQDVPLFHSKEPLDLQASGSIKSIKKKTNDSTFVTGKFQYEKAPGEWITIPTEARVRGNYRLNNCFFPPLKLKFKKSDVKGSLFEGTKSLKLVMPCLNANDKNTLIRKEYLCYQFYETLSPYYFKTRLAKLKLTEVSRKKPRDFALLTFLVEDNSQVAKRSQGKILELRGLNPDVFEEKQSVRNDFFQYMIGNADWSAVYQHNSNVMYADGKYIALSYDFDMAGFVNAGYSHINAPQLGTGDPRERVYRGFCKSKSAMEEIRKEYLDKEAAIHGLIDKEGSHFNENDLKDMHGYLDQFFRILKSDGQFATNILNGCRTDK